MNRPRDEATLPLEDKTRSSLDGLDVPALEQVLVDLLVVKYPGIEQSDVDRFLAALDHGRVDEVERVEADMALKSQRWQRAAQDLVQ